MNGWFEAIDSGRRLQGNMLDYLGLGPEEQPYAIIHEQPGARLRCYQPLSSATGHKSSHSALLIIPAPIKRPYVWDMAPDLSVVRHALKRGLAVYLVEWTSGPNPRIEDRLGLEYCIGDLLPNCLEQIARQKLGTKVYLAGHSLGGTFAAIYSALRPEQVSGLILVEAPVRFGEATGPFRKLLHLGISPSTLAAGCRRVPGSLLSVLAAGAAPGTFHLERQLDLMRSWDASRDWLNHWRGIRWTLDEFSMPRRLFEDTVELLYRQDQFMAGTLTIENQPLNPELVSAPLMAIYNPDSRIVPPASILDFYEKSRSVEKSTLPFRGESGVALQHLAPLIGDQAHAQIWPRVFSWIEGLGRH